MTDRLRTLRARLAGEDGFTIFELMVTMAMSIIVLLAVLLTVDTFTRGSAATSGLTQVEDNNRQNMDTMVRSLRDAPRDAGLTPANPVRIGSATNLIFKTPYGWERFCLDVTTGALRAGTLAGSTYTTPTGACATGSGAGWTYTDLAASGVSSSTAAPLFTYTLSGTATIAVTIRLTRDIGQGRSTQLTSTAYLRNS